jgi:iron complex outermembrane recepter protein
MKTRSNSGFRSVPLGVAMIASVGTVVGTTSTVYGQQSEAIEEVQITGSRIVRSDNVQSPTPVVDLSATDINDSMPQGPFYSLIDLPQFSGSSGPQGFIGLQTGSAQQSLDLRNLGSQRMLVLLDGVRVAPSDAAGTVDVSLIPTSLLSRVDVVTGGASASYGSDAVSGVVNYILNTNYEGFKAEASGGVSTYGDSASEKLSSAFGTSFASGAGHIIASVDYYHQDPILGTDTNRAWERYISELVLAPGKPVLSTAFGTSTLVPAAGLVINGPLAGTTFNSAGNPVPYNFGSFCDANNCIRGGGNQNISSLMTEQNTINLFTHIKYDLSDWTSAFVEIQYARDRNWDTAQQDFIVQANYVTIFNDNPFVTPQTLALMNAKGVTSFEMQKLGPYYDTATGIETTYRFAGGFNGKFTNDWTWTSYLQFTRSQDEGIQGGAYDWQRLYAAVNAVKSPTTGQPVCQSTLLYGLNPGCVPINLMGPDGVSQAAYNYVTGLPNQRTADLPEWNAGLSTQVPVFSLWAKPTILAAGVEYRNLGFRQIGTSNGTGIPDYTGIAGVPPAIIGVPGQFMTGGWASYSGTEKVTEGFAELDMPIVEDKLLAHDLNANMAVRQEQYDPAGPATTWKVGLNYEPVSNLRLRVTDSYDIHAPTPQDLYNPSALTEIGSVVDPITGKTLPSLGYTLGNPDLKPERGWTYTYGVVYTPLGARGPYFSADYWNIQIKGAIASVGTAQTVLNECELQNDAFACGLISGRGSGLLSFSLPVVNNTLLATSGVDLEAREIVPLGKGDLALRTVWTWLEYYSQSLPGAPTINNADEYGRWNGMGSVTYSQGPYSAAVNVRFLDHRTINDLYQQGVFIDNNFYPSHTYINLNLAYTMGSIGHGGEYQIFANVQNLTNNQPDFRGLPDYIQIPTLQAFGGAVAEDVIGRYYRVGVRAKFW